MKYIICCFFIISKIWGQSSATDFSHKVQQQLQRIEIHSGRLFTGHSAILPFNQVRQIQDLSNYYSDYLKSNEDIDTNDLYELVLPHALYLKNSREYQASWDKFFARRPIAKYFYQVPYQFYSYSSKHFYFGVNPFLDIHLGKEKDSSAIIFQNLRGIDISGGIDQRVFFKSRIIETQSSFSSYVQDYISTHQSVPGAAFVKKYESQIFKIENGYDFLIADALVNFRATKHIDLSLGHGTHFIGSGIRSLLLSDFTTPYFYFRVNTSFWKINYQNIFAELSPQSKFIGTTDRLLPKKYMASHYLSINLLKNWNVGIFESVVFARQNQFELQYLNPIILYRSVEQAIGSPDNVLLGMHSHLNLWKRFSLYGQLLLDEFVIKELVVDNKGWWANKYGFQIGAKYIDAFGLPHLNIAVEHNRIRPYTYTFRDTVPANYTHYQQELAHPLGANFKENLVQIDYKFLPRWNINLDLLQYQKGLDIGLQNYGGNINRSHDDHRVSDYNNKIGQGLEKDVLQISIGAQYELFPNLFVSINGTRRTQSLGDGPKTNTTIVLTGIRWNIDSRKNYF